MSTYLVSPVSSFHRTVFINGDKSVSHRALIFSALKKQKTIITGLSEAADPMTTRSVLSQLGVEIRKKGDEWVVNGVGKTGFKDSKQLLDVGNSGTTIRLLSGILAGQDFSSTLNGDRSIQKRPMNRIIKPLRLMGANISGTEQGLPPLVIHGSGRLNGITYEMDVASAQVKSCILLAGLLAKGETIVIEKEKTRDHTERMLQIPVKEMDGKFHILISSQHDWEQKDIQVPGDTSSAAFWAVAACIIPDSVVTIQNICLNPTRIGWVDALHMMGADIQVNQTGESAGEPIGDITARSSQLKGVELKGSIIPNIIDEIPILSIAATQAEGTTTFYGVEELRVKESDRIHSIISNIKAMGGEAEDHGSGFNVSKSKLIGSPIETYHDHRIAMSFAIAGLVAEGQTLIKNSECASVSYPAFWKTLSGE